MARLRVRVELNRGGVGVPLHKLASVVHESQRFFEMLALDVHIEKDRGEWLGFDFDNESLNFTAEYVGPVTAEQVSAFCAAFDGVSSLRRATIAQFTRIADAIGEDELIGFGLYPADHDGEPIEWRCLSRRDALRIADEMQLLLGVSGELDQETRLPSVIDAGAAARHFKDRRDRGPVGADQRLPELVREVESNLTKRITRLEGEIENHSHALTDLRDSSAATEESFRGLLSAVENFCGQATRQLERLTPQSELPAASAPSAPSALSAPSAPAVSVELPPEAAPAPEAAPPLEARPTPEASAPSSSVNWRALAVAAVIVVGLVAAAFLFWPSRQPEPRSAEAASAPAVTVTESSKPPEASQPASSVAVPVEKPSAIAPAPSRPKPDLSAIASASVSEPGSKLMRVDLEARDLVWVTVTDVDGKTLMARTLQPHESRTLELTKNATLRTGNAGGLQVRFNGADIGPLGPSGKVRDVQFKAGAYKILLSRDAG
ncbi:MAG: DUF4115 domain-containing protein [Acidobacteriia bacterium]|nr:DUF4115 domain-containing protein [Terriglobia bacterium]